MIKVKNRLTKEIVYFKFFASEELFPNCFWYTRNNENTGFEMGSLDYYEPIGTTWEEITDEKI